MIAAIQSKENKMPYPKFHNINAAVQDIIDLYQNDIGAHAYQNQYIDYSMHKSHNIRTKNDKISFTPVFAKDKTTPLPRSNKPSQGNINNKQRNVFFSKIGSEIMSSSSCEKNKKIISGKLRPKIIKRMQEENQNQQFTISFEEDTKEDSKYDKTDAGLLNLSNSRSGVGVNNISISVANVNNRSAIQINRRLMRMKITEPIIEKTMYKIEEAKEICIDNSVTFLRDLSSDTYAFTSHLKLLEVHLEIDGLLQENPKNKNNNNNNDALSGLSSKLVTLLNIYFQLLNELYSVDYFDHDIDSFFVFPQINSSYQKALKLQVITFATMLLSLTQLSITEQGNILKAQLKKLMVGLSSSLLILVEFFAIEEITINYSEILTHNLKNDFLDKYSKSYKLHKINKGMKNSDVVTLINKGLEHCLMDLKHYNNLTLKYSLLKPYSEALVEVFTMLDKKTVSLLSRLFMNSLIYGELAANKLAKQCYQVYSNVNCNVDDEVWDHPPYLPPIVRGYSYTLVLDLDETLIHFFYTHSSGMFLVRPYCFDFLQQLSSMYEIVIFTAGTKEYAEDILNSLDRKGAIKHRLYREHTSLSDSSVVKDLSKLGRELSKTIIVDNVQENFKLQPHNGFVIKTWNGDILDTSLLDLMKILKDIYILSIPDVRDIIKKVNIELQSRMKRNCINPYASLDITKFI